MSPAGHKAVRGLVDYGGLVAFLAGFLVTRDVVQATWWLVGGSAVSLAIGLAVERRLAPFPLIAGGAALVFGGLTLFFDDPRFVKMKPTIMNLAFAAALLGGLAFGKNPLSMLLGSSLSMPDKGWRKLTVRYGVFFLAVAAVNEAVWRTQPDAVWVVFRFPGLMILTLVFAFTQVPLMMKYAHTNEPPPTPPE